MVNVLALNTFFSSEVLSVGQCLPTSRLHHQFLISHLSLYREGRWGTTDSFETSFLHFSTVLHWPLGLCKLKACPFPDVVFPPLLLSALSFSPFHCALQNGFWPNLLNGRHGVYTRCIYSHAR